MAGEKAMGACLVLIALGIVAIVIHYLIFALVPSLRREKTLTER